MIFNKIRQFVIKHFNKLKTKNAEIFLARLAQKEHTEKLQCPRCKIHGGNNGYFEKWIEWKALLSGFSKRKVSPFGVCFQCRGGSNIFEIIHIVEEGDSLEKIATKYDIVFCGHYRTNEPRIGDILGWNRNIQNNTIHIGQEVVVWVDLHIWHTYLTNQIRTRFRNGYQQYFDKFDRKWKWVHRTVAHMVSGENIQKGWEVHHVDHQKTNNNPLNLIPLPRKLHQDYHHLERLGKVKRGFLKKFINTLTLKNEKK
tara:strand:- start:789 stop:1553 length:765 start_codon:yes stop_codon:yes gene_type:complete